jgi:hypothetical protein
MNRSRMLLLAAGLGLVVGCVHDGEWTVERMLGWDGPEAWKKGKVSVASVQVAERVETLGRRIIAQNTFTGLDPLFMTINPSETVLFHRGTEQLWISEKLVKMCHSDAELAALLCTELGRMMAEKRLAQKVGRDKESIPDVVSPTGSAVDVFQTGTIASREMPIVPGGRDVGRGQSTDPATLARELLRGVGFDPAEFDKVAPLLKLAEGGETIRKQIVGSGPVPTWEN